MQTADMGTRQSVFYTPHVRRKYGLAMVFTQRFLFFGPVIGGNLLAQATGSAGSVELRTFGFMLGLAASIYISPRLSCLYMRGLGRKLLPLLDSRYGASLSDALHVGISAGGDIRNFQGDTSWDIGYLKFEQGRAVYYGDRTTFEIRPDQITDARIVEFKKDVMVKFPKLVISWRESAESMPDDLLVELRDIDSLGNLWRQTRALQQRVSEWKWQTASPDAVTSPQFGHPPRLADLKPLSKPAPKHVGCGLQLAVGFAAIVVGVIISIVVINMLGEELMKESAVLRYIPFAITFVIFNIALAALRRKKDD